MTDSDNQAQAGHYERPEEASSGKALVNLWLDAIELSAKEESDWLKDGKEAFQVYTADEAALKGTTFNLYFANVETTVPALYNSTPIPDVRRRFNDKDPVAKDGSDAIERVLSYVVDEYDFDDVIRAAVYHYTVAGRGVVRVTYQAHMQQIGMDPMTGEPVEDVGAQTVACRTVPWAGFRRGPAECWEDMPWVAFPHHMGRDDLVRLSPKYGKAVKLDETVSEKSDKEAPEGDAPEAEVFKRTLVWEIWDKAKRKVLFIAPCFKADVLAEIDDPLGLSGFFPVPRPMTMPRGDDSLVPVCTYRIQRPILEEIDTISQRIIRLVRQLRPRALGPGGVDLDALAKANDGEIVEVSNTIQYLEGGGMDKLLSWFPMEPTVVAVKALYERREALKADLFEVSGLADVMRGQTKSSETLGAQQIKTQWGSLRIQKHQQEVQRFIRDLFRMKAELIAEKFTPDNIAAIIGAQINPQVMALLKDERMRSYRIDIETDSTIRGDLTRNMQAMSEFVQGSAAYFQSFAPAVQAGFPMEALITIYSAFARNFKLGKEVDAILDQIPDMVKQQQAAAQQAAAQQPNPEAEKAKMEVEVAKTKAGIEVEKAKTGLQVKQAELGIKSQEMKLKAGEMQQKAALSQMSHEQAMKQKIEQAQLDAMTMKRAQQ